MKIRKISIFQHDLPVKGGGYRMANAMVTTLDTTLVKIESDCGVVGWGETCPGGSYLRAKPCGGRPSGTDRDGAPIDRCATR